MPIKVPDHLPAKEILQQENIFVMNESRAFHQDIRPLQIAILNLMPNKQATEVQLLRLIGNTPLQVEATLLHMESHISKNTSLEYLTAFYKVFGDVKAESFDGMIITGAPVEMLPFENVTYWKELTEIMEWTKSHVFSTFHICWGAQAGLYYHYAVPKYPLKEKMFGVFPHIIQETGHKLFRGFDAMFYAPHSRHTETRREDVLKIPELSIWSESPSAGLYIIGAAEGRQIFVTGHSEYDPHTLADEYFRDVSKGESVALPINYFQNDDPNSPPKVTWRAHANLLYANWLHYVYQETPYDLSILRWKL